jgi:hypothetical protein
MLGAWEHQAHEVEQAVPKHLPLAVFFVCTILLLYASVQLGHCKSALILHLLLGWHGKSANTAVA